MLLYKTFYIKATDKMLEALLLPDWDSLGCSLIPQAVASADEICIFDFPDVLLSFISACDLHWDHTSL